MCFSPQRRAISQHLNFKKCSEPDMYLFNWKCASRHSGVQFLISPLTTWLRTRRFNEPTFRLSRHTNHWKNTAFRDFSNIWRGGWISFLLTFALLHLLSSDSTSSSDCTFLWLYFIYLLFICFSTLHIVRSLLFKLPSINIENALWIQHHPNITCDCGRYLNAHSHENQKYENNFTIHAPVSLSLSLDLSPCLTLDIWAHELKRQSARIRCKKLLQSWILKCARHTHLAKEIQIEDISYYEDLYLYGQNGCVARDPSGAFNGKLKNVAGVRILGIGEVVRFSCLGVGSLTELPLKPETLKHKP